MVNAKHARLLPVLLAVPILCAMAPGDMSVAAFLARAASIERLGPLALATPQGHQLKGEVVAAGKRYKARIDAERRAGRKTTSCRSEEHTSELQSLMRISYAVFCLKKKKHNKKTKQSTIRKPHEQNSKIDHHTQRYSSNTK